MRIGHREVIFSVNSYFSAMLALYVSLCCDLDRPYWAMMTAYITSQPFTGAVHSKAIYRIIGTVLGAAMMVFLIPPLSNAPPLLSMVIALWVGICLFFSLLDRTPRSYVFLLAGYTTVFVGFPIVTAPISVFDVAVTRVEEICIGVLCSTLFHTVFFPRSLRQILSHQFTDAVTDVRTWVVDTLARKKDAVHKRGRIRLAADITDLHLAATHIPFDTHEPQEVSEVTTAIQNKLIQLFPIITGVSDRLKRLEDLGPLPQKMTALLRDVSDWLKMPSDQLFAHKAEIQRKCIALKKIKGPPSWRDMLTFNITSRLTELVNVYASCRQLVGVFGDTKAIRTFTPKVDTVRGTRVLHTDPMAAVYTSLMCFGIIFSGSLLWIFSGRPEGSTAVMMGGVTYCLFASMPNPVPAQKKCLYLTTLGSLAAGIYLFLIFPHVHSFLTLALVLSPVLLVSGALLAVPKVGMSYMSFVIPFCASLTLTRHFSPDFENFLNFNAAQFVGIAAVVAATNILHRFSARKRINYVLHTTWSDIAALAHGTRSISSAVWMSLMVDRIGLLAPYVDVIKSSESLKSLNAMREMRTGLNVIRFSRVIRRLPDNLIVDAEALLHDVGRYFDALAASGEFIDPPENLLRQIDVQIATLSSLSSNRLKETIFNALTGLRCNLFPQAWAYMYGIDWHD